MLSKPTIKIAIVIGLICTLTAYTHFVVIPMLLKPAKPTDYLVTEGGDKYLAKGSADSNLPNVAPPNKLQQASDSNSSEARYKKMQALMSLVVSGELSGPEQNKAVEQILAEMPQMVKAAHINPTEATFAHMVLLQSINRAVTADMMDDVKRKYTNVYPKGLEQSPIFNLD